MNHRQVAVGLRGLGKSYGATVAVSPLDLDIYAGDFLAVLGPSGCGKTSLLRMIGGFVEPSQGRIRVAGADVTDLPPEQRPTNMVFQGYGLFPHMNVRQNIAYGLKLRNMPKPDINQRVDRMLDLVRMGDLSERGVAELSGGQQQRVAVARALVMEPPVLLLDEPFAALDLKLRQAMQDELRRIQREVGGTFVFVTHDQGEALALANRIAVMNSGRIEQIGTPEQIYLRPETRFVAQFIGEANVLQAHRKNNTVTLNAGAALSGDGPNGEVLVVIRPENAVILADPTRPLSLQGHIEEATFFGSHVRYVVQLSSDERMRVQMPISHRFETGQAVHVHCPLGQAQIIAA
jgi:spermidine/putrescine transport system ATP-binding protein